MWAGLNVFDPRTNFVFGSVRIGMGCMNLITVISRQHFERRLSMS